MLLSDFVYDLPKELIAQDPLEKRDNSKLLVIDRKTGNLEHKYFYDVVDYLNSGDTLVINDTKVIPARLIGHLIKKDANEDVGYGRACEIFLVRRKTDKLWECLVRPGKKLKVGAKVSFGDGLLIAKIVDIVDDGNRLVEFIYDGIFEEIIDKLGVMPLPPYITHELKDNSHYQTVYAKIDGSVAAPTAGLHFTNDLLDKIKNKGVNIAKVTLHVSLGTFRPVKVDNIEEHHMHTEEFHISRETADLINETHKNGKKVICVGTTSMRSVEAAATYDGNKKYILKQFDGETNIFIYPGYQFKIADALITNFHLPGSTLLMLVSAFSSREIVLNAYGEAIKNKYRFFSFGDACLFI